MHRTQLLSLLRNYHPTAVDEQKYKEDIIAFVTQQPDCFERTLAPGHITASAWLLNKDGTQALLMHHTKLNVWVQLGGHCDGNSDAGAVALKEAQEESGIHNIIPVSDHIFDIDIHLIPARKTENEHYHYDIRFLLRVADDAPCIQNEESQELRWITRDPHQLPTASRSVVRMFDKWTSNNPIR